MSRIGKLPVAIPAGVELTIEGTKVEAKGPKGVLALDIHPRMKVTKTADVVLVTRTANDKLSRALHGLTRQLIQNIILGVTTGFERKLEIKGIGYRAEVKGETLVLSVGYSHPVEYKTPAGISFKVEKNIITVAGIDKQLVGQVAAEIRQIRKPEPYKGKGIKYLEEVIRRKAGKTAKAVGAA